MFISGESGLSPFFWLNRNKYSSGMEECLLFSTARGALNYYLSHLKRKEGTEKREVLLPAYICDDLVLSLEQMDFDIVYYKVRENLEPDTEDVKEKITANTLSILIVHYFGFFVPVDDIVKYCKGKGVPVVEDYAHVLFESRERVIANLKGDAAIFSLRKYFPIPDGGLLFVKEMKMDSSMLERCNPMYSKVAKSFVKYTLNHLNMPVFRNYAEPNHGDKASYGIKKISLISEMFLRNYINIQYIKYKRRENFSRYLQVLRRDVNRDDKFEIIYHHLRDSEIPYMFPLRLKGNNGILVEKMKKEGVPAINWPDLPGEVKCSPSFSMARELQERIVLLPLHQDIRRDHIDHIVKKFRQFI